MTLDKTDPLYARAKRRYRAKAGFAAHATAFAFVNTGLFLIDLVTGPGIWFVYPLIGWGSGLLMHGLATRFVTSGGHERGIAAELARMKAEEAGISVRPGGRTTVGVAPATALGTPGWGRSPGLRPWEVVRPVER